MTTADKLNERMRALWQKFRPEMLRRLEVISKAIAALRAGDLPNALRLQAVHAAHKLAGSLGTFGLQEGSNAAQQIERLLSDERTNDIKAVAISRYFDRLQQEIESR